jgi:hypothetical protein
MATAYIVLFPGGIAPDGSGSGNNTAGLSYEVSAAAQGTNSPKATQLKLLFDASTDEHWLFSLLIPADYASGGTLRGTIKFTSATSGVAIMKAAQVTSVDSSTDDDALAFGTADVSASITAPGTQGQTIGFTVALTTTNMAASRKSVIFIGRDADNASDTAAGDVELLALNLEYTVS